MSFEKRSHNECHHIQKCSFHPIVKSNPINDLSYLISQLTPSYATFWCESQDTAISSGSALLLNHSGVKTSNISLNTVTGEITVLTAGVYQISYSASIFFNNATPQKYNIIGVSITQGLTTTIPTESKISTQFIARTPIEGLCNPVAVTFTAALKSGSVLKLINAGSNSFELCNGNNNASSAIFYLERLGPLSS